ncbi:MAG: hypothetical protein AB7G06_09475 [Bdellovibrionales bacterium]
MSSHYPLCRALAEAMGIDLKADKVRMEFTRIDGASTAYLRTVTRANGFEFRLFEGFDPADMGAEYPKAQRSFLCIMNPGTGVAQVWQMFENGAHIPNGKPVSPEDFYARIKALGLQRVPAKQAG